MKKKCAPAACDIRALSTAVAKKKNPELLPLIYFPAVVVYMENFWALPFSAANISRVCTAKYMLFFPAVCSCSAATTTTTTTTRWNVILTHTRSSHVVGNFFFLVSVHLCFRRVQFCLAAVCYRIWPPCLRDATRQIHVPDVIFMCCDTPVYNSSVCCSAKSCCSKKSSLSMCSF